MRKLRKRKLRTKPKRMAQTKTTSANMDDNDDNRVKAMEFDDKAKKNTKQGEDDNRSVHMDST